MADEELISTHDAVQEDVVVKIRFASGQTISVALPLSARPNCTVSQFKQHVREFVVQKGSEFAAQKESDGERQLCEQLARNDKYMRLIYQGKLLPDAALLSSFRMKSGEFLHCTLAERPSTYESISVPTITTNLLQQSQLQLQQQLQSQQESQPEPQSQSQLQSQQESQSPQPQQQETTVVDDRPRGFDRLRESGFSDEDVAFIRNQFYSTRQQLLAQVQQRLISTEQLHQMEEQWMSEDMAHHGAQASQDQQQQENEVIDVRNGSQYQDQDQEDGDLLASSSDGNSYHMFAGVLLGFVLGIIMIIWVCSVGNQCCGVLVWHVMIRM